MKLLFIFGTRPEAIKLAPIIKLAQFNPKFNVKILVTAQHRQMLDQVLKIFNLVPDYDLDLMKENQDLTDITIRILEGCRKIFSNYRPDLAFVHGDTTTTFAASLAAFYQKIDIAHVEAGLRTNNMYSPFPEELNRVLTSRIAKFHFSPTEESAANLIREGISKDRIVITGNTVIDSLLAVIEKIHSNKNLENEILSQFLKIMPEFGTKPIVLITGHRRESFGAGLTSTCEAIMELSNKFPNYDFVYPVHMNPNVQTVVNKILSKKNNIFLIGPLEYLPFTYLMSKSHMIITDSGGVQEEAPSLGKPILVTREMTERPEAIASGVAKLVGTNKELIISTASELLSDETKYNLMANKKNPYGDGQASSRILNSLLTV